ncbi:hypothetical protein D6D04_07585 [Aureobasidium pullulans]|nr:hypothetical protein D6D04_07585 [Aureobasidium pullulans]
MVVMLLLRRPLPRSMEASPLPLLLQTMLPSISRRSLRVLSFLNLNPRQSRRLKSLSTSSHPNHDLHPAA